MEYKLPSPLAGARIFSSECRDGPMNWANREGQRNLAKFLRRIGSAGPFCSGGQPHQRTIQLISRPGRYEKADGLLTSRNFALGVKTADCVPLILFEKESGLIGALHVSRLNLLEGIISQSLGPILRQVKISPQSLAVFLGPHIRSKNYDLKEGAIRKIRQTRFAQFLHKRSGGFSPENSSLRSPADLPADLSHEVLTKWEALAKAGGGAKGDEIYFDLTAALRGELEALGIKRENVIDCGLDTYTDRRFFSSRRRKNKTSSVETFVTVVFKNDASN